MAQNFDRFRIQNEVITGIIIECLVHVAVQVRTYRYFTIEDEKRSFCFLKTN